MIRRWRMWRLKRRYLRAYERERYSTVVQRREVQRTVSALMDDAPEWRHWLEWQLYLLDLDYDPHHWITMEGVT